MVKTYNFICIIPGATDFRNSSLESQEDFDKFKDDIVKQLGESTKNQNFPFFVEQLVQSLCVHCKYDFCVVYQGKNISNYFTGNPNCIVQIKKKCVQ